MYQDVSYKFLNSIWSVFRKLTFHDINHTEAQEAGHKVGWCCVHCNGTAHAVPNQHDWRREVPIHGFNYIANISAKREILECWRRTPKIVTNSCGKWKRSVGHSTNTSMWACLHGSWYPCRATHPVLQIIGRIRTKNPRFLIFFYITLLSFYTSSTFI